MSLTKDAFLHSLFLLKTVFTGHSKVGLRLLREVRKPKGLLFSFRSFADTEALPAPKENSESADGGE